MSKILGWMVHFCLSGVGVFIVAKLMPGISVRGFGSAIWFAVVLAVFNALAWSILAPITWPFAFLTLGLGILVVNTVVFVFAGRVVNGVRVSGWLTAFLASIALSLVNGAIHRYFGR